MTLSNEYVTRLAAEVLRLQRENEALQWEVDRMRVLLERAVLTALAPPHDEGVPV